MHLLILLSNQEKTTQKHINMAKFIEKNKYNIKKAGVSLQAISITNPENQKVVSLLEDKSVEYLPALVTPSGIYYEVSSKTPTITEYYTSLLGDFKKKQNAQRTQRTQRDKQEVRRTDSYDDESDDDALTRFRKKAIQKKDVPSDDDDIDDDKIDEGDMRKRLDDIERKREKRTRNPHAQPQAQQAQHAAHTQQTHDDNVRTEPRERERERDRAPQRPKHTLLEGLSDDEPEPDTKTIAGFDPDEKMREKLDMD